MIQTRLLYEFHCKNYDLHAGISPQNFAAEDLLMNDTTDRHWRYRDFSRHFTRDVTSSSHLTTSRYEHSPSLHILRFAVYS
jgi:hypothetical protein